MGFKGGQRGRQRRRRRRKRKKEGRDEGSEKGKKKEMPEHEVPFHWFTSQIPTTLSAQTGLSQKLRTYSRSLTGGKDLTT